MSNEQRLVVFIILSGVILFGYNMLFPQPKVKLPPAAASQSAAMTPVKGAAVQAGIVPLDSLKEASASVVNVPKKNYTMENDLVTVTFSNIGAVMGSYRLKNYSDSDLNTKQAALELIPSGSSNSYMSMYSPGLKLDSAPWVSDGVKEKDGKKTISFSVRAGKGVTVVKEFSLGKGSYITNMNIKFMNSSGVPVALKDIQLYWGPNIHLLPEGMQKTKDSFNRGQNVDYPLADNKIKAYQVNLKAKEDKITVISEQPKWIVLKDLHFMASFMFPDLSKIKNVFYKESAGGYTYLGVNLNDVVLPAGASDSVAIDSYIGPQEYKRLTELKMQGIINLGWIRILGVWMFYAMDFLYKLTKNYGIAILLLTLLVRLVLWIPSQNSYKQMKETQSKMKIINPRMETLKKIYKDDAQKLNEETMKLYKEYKINPFGGCLPMVLQVPIFIALYQTLISMVELKGAYFFGWLKDLSRPDPFFVLPVFMGVSMIIQQKMTTTVSMSPEAETQQKMMMWGMPLFLTFMALKWPSGLLLYWGMSNILAILQQYFVNKKK